MIYTIRRIQSGDQGIARCYGPERDPIQTCGHAGVAYRIERVDPDTGLIDHVYACANHSARLAHARGIPFPPGAA